MTESVFLGVTGERIVVHDRDCIATSFLGGLASEGDWRDIS
jgi:hypothetical protein